MKAATTDPEWDELIEMNLYDKDIAVLTLTLTLTLTPTLTLTLALALTLSLINEHLRQGHRGGP